MFRITLILLYLLSFQLQSKNKKINLSNAIDSKIVHMSANSLGGHNGFCVELRVSNLSKDSLILVVEAGTIFNSVENKFQDILVTKEEIIALRRAEERTLKVKGYCCQASNWSPSVGAKFNLRSGDTNLLKLARYLNANNFDANAEQYAVWAVSDRRPTANINSAPALKLFVSGLKCEVVPWYQLSSNTYVQRSGEMMVTPVALTGDMNYSLDETSYATLSIKDKNGFPVCFQKSQWLLKGVAQKYELNIPLNSLQSGKYTIELNTREKQIARREFEI